MKKKTLLLAAFSGILAKWNKDAIVALDLTTDTGGKLVFADVAPDATPVKGDVATLDGAVPPAEVKVVDNTDKVFMYKFDDKGALTEDPTEEVAAGDEDTEALKAENEELKTQLAAMTAKFKGIVKDVDEVKRQIVTGKYDDVVAKGKREEDEDEDNDDESAKDRKAILAKLDGLKNPKK